MCDNAQEEEEVGEEIREVGGWVSEGSKDDVWVMRGDGGIGV